MDEDKAGKVVLFIGAQAERKRGTNAAEFNRTIDNLTSMLCEVSYAQDREAEIMRDLRAAVPDLPLERMRITGDVHGLHDGRFADPTINGVMQAIEARRKALGLVATLWELPAAGTPAPPSLLDTIGAELEALKIDEGKAPGGAA